MIGRQLGEPVDALLHNRFQQIGFGGEMPVHGAGADTGLARDLGKGDRGALLGEGSLRGGEHQCAIAAGVGPRRIAERRCWSRHSLRPSIPDLAKRVGTPVWSEYGSPDPILSSTVRSSREGTNVPSAVPHPRHRRHR
jgi:hypothetical protein